MHAKSKWQLPGDGGTISKGASLNPQLIIELKLCWSSWSKDLELAQPLIAVAAVTVGLVIYLCYRLDCAKSEKLVHTLDALLQTVKQSFVQCSHISSAQLLNTVVIYYTFLLGPTILKLH